MIKIIKKLLRMDNIQWVKNTQIEYDHLESDKYLLVHNYKEGPLLFTPNQVDAARVRANKQKEDI
jgi:hypothetical protein